MKEVIAALKKAESVLIATHTDPDGDAIGSMIAVYLGLRSLGKKATMYCKDPVPEIYEFLPDSDKIKHSIDKGESFDVAVAVDCGDIKRVDGGLDLRKYSPLVVNIDHHPDNTRFGNINYVQGISSVSEMIYNIFKTMKIKMTKDIGTCIYTGIMTDTGNFRYDYTTADTLAVAEQLARSGVGISNIAMQIYETKTMSSIKILGAAMYRLESSGSGKVAWTVLPKQLMDSLGAKSEDLTGLVDYIRSIKGVEVAVLFREEDDGIKVNFRSKFKVNVSDIAKKLGGGGHIRASGAVISGPLDDAKKKVLDEVFKVIK